MILDTLVVVSAAVDSLSQQISSQVGTQVTSLVLLALGTVVKIVMDFSKSLSVKLGEAPSGVKALVAVLFSQLAVWGSTASGIAINTDINALDVTVVGFVISAIAMGVNAGLKSIGISVKSKRTPVEDS